MIKPNNALGILLMVLSMIAFAVADTFVKVLSADISPAQVLFFLVAGGTITFLLLTLFLGDTFWDRRAFAPILWVRYVSEIIGMTGMVLALALVPLSTVGAITQATPILVAVGAVLFLGEKVSWRRWSAIAVGFLGVLLIIQPGAESFDKNVLWALVAMAGLSVRDLTTRLTPEGLSSTALAAYTMIFALPFTVFWVWMNGEALIPENVDWILVALMSTIGSAGYLSLIFSLRMAEVSLVTPFRYSRILILMLFGFVFFGERPNALMLFGATLIIASGVYMMWRERVLKQNRR